MMISSYADLILAARQQPETQRLLFVFCRAEIPEDASATEVASFQQGEGGALVPVLCVDKAVDEAECFETLVAESKGTGQDWDVAFVSALAGRGGFSPTSDEAQQPLSMMVEGVRLGHVSGYIAISRQGSLIKLQ